MLSKFSPVPPLKKTCLKPTRFSDHNEFGETSNNHLNTFWRVKPDGNLWLAESCVRGAGHRMVFKEPSKAEQWARNYAYSKSKSWGGF